MDNKILPAGISARQNNLGNNDMLINHPLPIAYGQNLKSGKDSDTLFLIVLTTIVSLTIALFYVLGANFGDKIITNEQPLHQSELLYAETV